ncbi:MAG: hypothetical protein PHU23_03195 [Dehalococcoidales bacterium]|nr:hypothetical protein [Dehalococcoidales bacterium]
MAARHPHLHPIPKYNKSAERPSYSGSLQREESLLPPLCYLCKCALKAEDYLNNNVKSIIMNGRSVLVHRTCPKEGDKH